MMRKEFKFQEIINFLNLKLYFVVSRRKKCFQIFRYSPKISTSLFCWFKYIIFHVFAKLIDKCIIGWIQWAWESFFSLCDFKKKVFSVFTCQDSQHTCHCESSIMRVFLIEMVWRFVKEKLDIICFLLSVTEQKWIYILLCSVF